MIITVVKKLISSYDLALTGMGRNGKIYFKFTLELISSPRSIPINVRNLFKARTY